MAEDKVYFEPPKKHWDLDKCSLENYNPRMKIEKNALKFMKEINKDSFLGAYIYGGFGNGKTHLLVGLARKLKEQNVNVAYAEAERMGYEFWKLLRDSSQYASNNPLTRSDVLIIDDMDIEKNMPWKSNLFYKLLLEKASQGTPLIMSSNHSSENLVAKIKIKEDEEIIKGVMGMLKLKIYMEQIQKCRLVY